jgi:hypothetical protein
MRCSGEMDLSNKTLITKTQIPALAVPAYFAISPDLQYLTASAVLEDIKEYAF